MTATINSESYPYFSAGQILKHSDLNNLIAFLDSQNRLTRGYAIGMGVIGDEGLEPILTIDVQGRNCIKVTKGVSLSSDGYIFPIEEDCEFCYFKKISVFENAFNLTNEEDRYEGEEVEVYELLEEKKAKETKGFELLPTDEVEFKKICDNKVLTLLWYREEQDRIPCFNECDEKGSDRVVFYKVILVDKSVFGEDQEEPPSTSSTIVIEDAPFISRLGVEKDGFGFKNISSFASLFVAYHKICMAAIPRISAAYLNAAITINKPEAFAQNLESILTTLLQSNFSTVSDNDIKGQNIQYFYDYLKDLILAYEEFADAACDVVDLRSGGVPKIDLHPGHVKLGFIRKEGTAFQEGCRDKYVAASLQSEKQDVDPLSRQKLNFLFQKMVRLVSKGSIIFSKGRRIKIIPSKRKNGWLSERAIPHYYNLNIVQSQWNFRISQKQQEDRIPNYAADGIGEPPFNTPLCYDMGRFDFFRVEGYFGKTLEEATKEIEDIRRMKNLPFDIQCVKLDNGIDFFEGHLFPEYEDLQLMYEKAKGDFLCYLEEITNVRTVPNITVAESEALENLLVESVKDFARITYSGFKSVYDDIFEKRNAEYDCLFEIFTEIRTAYLKRIKAQLFSIFSSEHPGLEHLAGVPKGGTLILAYVDEIPPELNIDPFDIRNFFDLFSFQNTKTAFDINTIDEQKRLEKSITQRVVADFCLPYHCCGSPLTNSKPQFEPLVLLLPRTFCEGDSKEYEIVTYPSGGQLSTLPNVDPAKPFIVERDGKYFFKPLNVPSFDAEPLRIELRYGIDSKTAIQTVEIHKGPEINVGLFGKKQPIYDPGQNCILIGFTHQFKISNFDENFKYAYVLDNEVNEFEGDKFKVDIPLSNDVYKFDIVAWDETNCEGKKEVEIESPCKDFDEGKIELKIENRPDIIHAGIPDELIVIAQPVGGHIKVQARDFDDNLVDIPVELMGTCEKRKFKIDTQNLRVGKYEIRYGFPVCGVEPVIVSFEIKEIPPPEEERPKPTPVDPTDDVDDVVVNDDEGTRGVIDNTVLPSARRSATPPPKKKKAVKKKSPKKVIPKSKSTKKLTPKKEPLELDAEVLNQRLSAHRNFMNLISQDSGMASSKGFGLSQGVILFMSNNVQTINSRFKEATTSLMRSIKQSSGEKEGKYLSVMQTLFHNFLDKQVVLQPESFDKETMELLEDLIKKLKGTSFDLAKAKKEWNSTQLKKAINAAVINDLVKMLK